MEVATMTKKQHREESIYRHGVRLKAIFKLPIERGAVDLYKTLHRLEAEAHRLAERECNEQLPEGYSERKTASILKRLDAILGFKTAGVPVFVNGDPRGYALKIEDAYVKEHSLEIERDWGGYGLLAPEF
jgi:hypothetical protein